MDETMRLRVLWFSMLGSVGLITAIMAWLPPPEAQPDQTLFIVLGCAALASAVLSFVVPGKVHAAKLAEARLATEDAPDPNAASGFGQVSRVKVFSHATRAREAGLLAYRMQLIMSLALSESVALFGLALNRIGHPLAVCLPFGAVALVLVAARMPSERAALAALERATGARLT